MLKYYSYYNVGGYKDMFLGDSSMCDKETYYLPLHAIWKKKALAGDAESETKLKSVENLPKIQLLSAKESLGLPPEAESMISHGGYKVLLTYGANGECIFAIRDIECDSKDESGRSIPFLFIIVSTTPDDAQALEKIAAYATSHLDSFSSRLSGLFVYDAEINGVIFKLAEMGSIVKDISADGSNKILTTDGVMNLGSGKGNASFLVVPEGISKDMALTEQDLKGKPVQVVPISHILPLDNQKKLAIALRNIKDVKSTILTDRRVQYLVAGTFVLGMIVGYLLGKS